MPGIRVFEAQTRKGDDITAIYRSLAEESKNVAHALMNEADYCERHDF